MFEPKNFDMTTANTHAEASVNGTFVKEEGICHLPIANMRNEKSPKNLKFTKVRNGQLNVVFWLFLPAIKS